MCVWCLYVTVERHTPHHSLQVLEAADAVIAAVDSDDLRRHYGTNIDAADEDAAAVRKDMDKLKATLVSALAAKVSATPAVTPARSCTPPHLAPVPSARARPCAASWRRAPRTRWRPGTLAWPRLGSG